MHSAFVVAVLDLLGSKPELGPDYYFFLRDFLSSFQTSEQQNWLTGIDSSESIIVQFLYLWLNYSAHTLMHSGDDDTREFFHVLVALLKERLKHFNFTHTSRHTEKWTHTFTISNKDTTLNIDRHTSGYCEGFQTVNANLLVPDSRNREYIMSPKSLTTLTNCFLKINIHQCKTSE